eukprot:IDg9429t1
MASANFSIGLSSHGSLSEQRLFFGHGWLGPGSTVNTFPVGRSSLVTSHTLEGTPGTTTAKGLLLCSASLPPSLFRGCVRQRCSIDTFEALTDPAVHMTPAAMYAFASPVVLPSRARHTPCTSRPRAARVRIARMSLAEAVPAAAGAPPASQEVDALVVGGGVSGTALAHSLRKAGVSLLLTEARDRVGGNVISRSENGYTWEEGPNTFQPAAHILRLAVDVGLKDELVLADHTLPRFVYWNERLFALPMSPKDLLTFRLLSLPGAIRAGLGAAGLVLPNLGGREETVREFVTRHLGDEVFRKMIDPFISGIYAGDPNMLSISAALKKVFALEQLGLTSGIVEGAIIRINQRKQEAPPLD